MTLRPCAHERCTRSGRCAPARQGAHSRTQLCSRAPVVEDAQPMSLVECCGARYSWRTCAGTWGANELRARQDQQDRQPLAAVMAHEGGPLRRGCRCRHIANVVGLKCWSRSPSPPAAACASDSASTSRAAARAPASCRSSARAGLQFSYRRRDRWRLRTVAWRRPSWRSASGATGTARGAARSAGGRSRPRLSVAPPFFSPPAPRGRKTASVPGTGSSVLIRRRARAAGGFSDILRSSP